MKLFYVPGTCSLSPMIVLKEANLPAELEWVDRNTHKTAHGADYYGINPNGYVPALQLDDGQVLTEGAVIVQYLADQKPESGLAPKLGTTERYRFQATLNFLATEIHKGFSPLFHRTLTDEQKAPFKERLVSRLNHVAKSLEAHPFLTGDSFTVADAYLFTVLSWSPRVGLDLHPWPSIVSYMERIRSRPAVRAALEAEGAKA